MKWFKPIATSGLLASSTSIPRLPLDVLAPELIPQHAECYTNRGEAYMRKGEFDRAIDELNKALELAPGSVEAYDKRGAAYAEKGKYDRAMEEFN